MTRCETIETVARGRRADLRENSPGEGTAPGGHDGAGCAPAGVTVRYDRASNRRVRARKRNVEPGQSVVFRPR